MRVLLCSTFALAVIGCDRKKADSPSPGPVTSPRDAAPAVAPPPAVASEITVAAEKTSAGGEVLAIGAARLRVTQHPPNELAVNLATKRAFATDREEVKIWELEGGTLVQRQHYDSQYDVDRTIGLAVSPDGKWLAASRAGKGAVMRAPFTTAAIALPISAVQLFFPPYQFSSDSRLLVGSLDSVATTIDLVRGARSFAQAPRPTPWPKMELAMSQQGGQVYWVRSVDALRWDPSTNTQTTIVKASPKWTNAVIATKAPVAVVTDKSAIYRLDLVTGALDRLGASPPRFAVSPSGERVALGGVGEIRVLEARGGKLVGAVPVTRVKTLVFADDDNTIAFIEDQTIRIHDLVKGPRAFPTPARFAGWLSGDVAALTHGASTQQLPIKTHVPAAVDAKALAARAPKPPDGAPTWATWLSTRADGTVVAAEPSKRRGLPAWRRGDEDCEPKLRVWTAQGGERTFTLKPSDGYDDSAVDPCWQLAGGYVIAAMMTRIEVYDAASGKKVATLSPGRPPEPIPDEALAHHYWAVTASPTGTHLALWWRRADIWPPPQPIDPRSHGDMGYDPKPEPRCETDNNYECKREYFAEVWSLTGKPRRVWRHRPDSRRWTGRTWPLPKVASGPIAFTHDGKHVLFGFDDGDIAIHAVDAAAPVRVESLHRAPIARIEVAPGDGYVFTEDATGEQRIWPLARP